jgi:alkylhydroperoxidase family enzyme
VQAVLRDFRTAPLKESERALLAFIQKVNRRAPEIRPQDIDNLKAAGWSDEALYDAITVCALFNFYDRWVDATGVHAMSEQECANSGKLLAHHGYVMG